MNFKRGLILWFLAVSYMALIFYISSIPGPIRYELPYGADKVLHLFEYALLGFILSLCLKGSGKRSSILFAWLIASLYGLSDEIHQSFVPGREASLADFLSDCTGGLIGAKLSQLIYNRNHLRSERSLWIRMILSSF